MAPLIIRDCAVQLRWRDAFSLNDFCEALGAPCAEAMPVLEAMIRTGYLEGTDEPFRPTSKLKQLAAAKISRGISRAEAERLLQDVIDRARHVNARPAEFCMRVANLGVFGSYLGSADLLGDLDIAVKLEPLPQADMSILEVFEASFGRKVVRFLRQRRRAISIHAWHEVMGLATPVRVLEINARVDRS